MAYEPSVLPNLTDLQAISVSKSLRSSDAAPSASRWSAGLCALAAFVLCGQAVAQTGTGAGYQVYQLQHKSAAVVEPMLTEMLPEVGGDMDMLAKAMLMKSLNKHGAEILTSSKVLRLTADTVVVEQGGEEKTLPVETVVVAVGVRSNRELPDALADSDLEVHVIGDAVEPRKALDAIYEGFEAARAL